MPITMRKMFCLKPANDCSLPLLDLNISNIYIYDLANALIQSDLIIITGLNMKDRPVRSNPVYVCVCVILIKYVRLHHKQMCIISAETVKQNTEIAKQIP